MLKSYLPESGQAALCKTVEADTTRFRVDIQRSGTEKLEVLFRTLSGVNHTSTGRWLWVDR